MEDLMEKIVLQIDAVGAQGDGIAQYQGETIYVPKTLTGEVVEGVIKYRRGAQKVCHVNKFIISSALRATPFCAHYAQCGGCSLQHLNTQAYTDFKKAHIDQLFKDVIDQGSIKWVYSSALAQRRRVSLSYKNDNQEITLGFFMQHSHRLVAIQNCPLLTESLNDLIAPLKSFLKQVTEHRDEGFLHLTDTATGIDCSWSPKRLYPRTLSDAVWRSWSNFAYDYDLARVTRAAKELIIQRREPKVDISGYLLDFPSAAFLQPSQASQEAMQKYVFDVLQREKILDTLHKGSRILDLFCGLGTFSLPFLRTTEADVHSYDYACASLDSLRKVHHQRLKVYARDLMNMPLKESEFKQMNLIVLDPPRAGAYAQVQEIARSYQGALVMISCDLATAKRDAKTLIDHGFCLKEIALFDQFPYTAHIEGVLFFSK